MTMETVNFIINGAVNFTFASIVIVLSIFALAAIWKWLIGVSIRFIHWLCPGLTKDKKNDSSDTEI